MDPDGGTPPLWAQPTTTHHRARRRPQPSPLLNPVAIIMIVPILLLLILFFVVPPFLSYTNQILRPNSVKKGWDSLNVVLLLFAILCGVFGRRTDDASSSDHVDAADHNRVQSNMVSNGSGFVHRPAQSSTSWMDFLDRKEYNYASVSSAAMMESGAQRLRRSTSSYPDLRQEYSSMEEVVRDRLRSYDDFEVNFRRPTQTDTDARWAFAQKKPPSPATEYHFHRHTRRSSHDGVRYEEASRFVNEIPVDKFEVNSAPPPPSPPPPSSTPPPPPPPPPLHAANSNRRRSLQSIPREKKVERTTNESKFSQNQTPAPPPQPPPPPAAAPTFEFAEHHQTKRLQKKKSGTKELATAIASLYKGTTQRKKKKKAIKSTRTIHETATDHHQTYSSSPSSVLAPPPSPPPPPPPPPPTKALHNLFKKSHKTKRVPPPPPPPPPNSIFNNLFNKSKRYQPPTTTAPPPPPPLPPSSMLNTLFKNGSKSKRHNKEAATSKKPPKPTTPTKPSTHNYNDNGFIVAPPSPLIPMPPPPPPPPFKMRDVKFVARGDYVRIRSAHSSRCSSPELEDVDVVSVKSDAGDSTGPAASSVACPSPDVNAKADSFIARLRDEWRLEKMNSMKERRRMSR